MLATEARIENGYIGKKRQTCKSGEKKFTSVFSSFHVEPSLILLDIFRSRFLGSIVQLADFMADDEIVALTRDFFFAHQKAPRRASDRPCFKRVSFEEHSSNGVFRCLALENSFTYTNLGYKVRN